MFAIDSEPSVSRLVMYVGRIEQRYQHGHGQECDHVALRFVT
jgi:hypothetical protein